jgi:hypothetical protein
MKVTLEHMMQHFQESAAGRKIIHEVDEAARREREPLLSRIAALRAEEAAKRPALKAARDAAEHREREAERALLAGQREYAIAVGAADSLAFSTGDKIARLEQQLRAGVPVEAKLLLDNFWDEMERAWQAGRSAIRQETKEKAAWPNRTVETLSNREAVEFLQDAIRIAQRTAAEQLELSADVSPGAIGAELDKLRAAIPYQNTPPGELPKKLIATVSGGTVTRVTDAPPSVYDHRGLTVIETPTRPLGELAN